MKRDRNPKIQSLPDRASNPLIPWLHGLAAMGDERIDSDLSTPYGDPMQGTLIYLSQHPKPGFLLSMLGLASK